MPRQADVSARSLALDVLNAVFCERPQPAEATFLAHAGLNRLEPRDRAFARLLYTTTLRRLAEIDASLAPFMRHPPQSLPLRNILRLGAAQLRYLETPAHAAIDQAVELAKSKAPKGTGLANAVLRKVANSKSQGKATVNLPDWLADSWRTAYGGETLEEICAAHLRDPPLDLTIRSDPELWAQQTGGQLLSNGTVRLSRPGQVDVLPGYADGAWWVQDVAASMPARLLGDISGERTLDLCAAPGGKTAQLCAAGANVTTVERSPSRNRLLRSNMKRLGFDPLIVEADALHWRADKPYDHILLDAPCTATGAIRRHPDILWTKQPSDVERLAKMQSALLEAAIRNLAPGGNLIYAVCSLQPEEGPAQIDALLEHHGGMRRDPINRHEIGGLPALISPAGDLRTLPSMLPEEGGMDGFFIARLIRDGRPNDQD